MSIVTPRRLSLAAVLVAAALAGCGSGGRSGGDEQSAKVAAMLRSGLSTTDPLILCERTLSAGLVRRMYGGAAQCLGVQSGAAGSRRPARSVEVSKVELDGDRGTAFVALRGGDEDGTRGALSVTRTKAGWRLDDLSTAFLRSEFAASLKNDPQLDARLRTCLGRTVAALDDPALRRLVFGALAGQAPARAQLERFVGDCVGAITAPPAGDAA